MTTPDKERLAALLEQEGALEDVLAFFDGLSEAQRRLVAPVVPEILEKLSENLETIVDGRRVIRQRGTFEARRQAAAALLASASLTEYRKASYRARTSDEVRVRVMSSRKPKWIDKWVEYELGFSPNSVWAIRQLVAAGVCQAADPALYYSAMIEALPERGDNYEFLTSETGFLDEDLWRMFEYDSSGKESWANKDRFSSGPNWSDCLVRLVAEGMLDRNRLLDASLSALDVGFNHYRSRWFFALFDLLEPTDDELEERADKFADLLGHREGNVAKWALGHVGHLVKQKLVSPTPVLVTQASALVSAPAKGTAKKALRLLRGWAKADASLQIPVAVASAVGLSHESADIQAEAWKLIEPFEATEELAAAVRQYQPLVAATMKGAVETWLGGEGATQEAPKSTPVVGVDRSVLDQFADDHVAWAQLHELFAARDAATFHVPAMTFDGTDIPRLPGLAQLAPVGDLDTLVLVAARALENPTAVGDAELALDGISRLCAERSDDFEQRTGPLLKRVRKLVGKSMRPFDPHEGLPSDLAGVVLAWLAGEVSLPAEPRTRTQVLAQRVARAQPAPLLSTPTHEGGWLDPAVLVERVVDLEGQPEPYDFRLALFRLAPDGRAAALKKLGYKRTEWGRALRYALGARSKVGDDKAPWAAASRARDPWAVDKAAQKALGAMGSNTVGPAEYRLTCTSRTSGKYTFHDYDVEVDGSTDNWAKEPVAAGLFQPMPYYFGPDESLTPEICRLATVWPMAMEAFFSHGARALANNVDWGGAAWHNVNYIRPLLDPNLPLRTMALHVLGIGLCAKEPGEHGLAVDIAIAAISDGRLGTDNLGAILRTLIQTPLVQARRWTQRFEVIASVSDLHAHVLLTSLSSAFVGDPSDMLRHYSGLLELLHELCVQLGVGISNPETREFLEAVTGSSKAAKLAKKLLALELGAGRPDLLDAVIGHRVSRLSALGRGR